MSKKVAAVIVGTTGAVLAGVLGYAAYLNKRYDLDLEHLHEDDEDDYEEDEDCLFGFDGTEEDGEDLSECEDDECEDFDFGSDEPNDGIDLFKSGKSDCLSDDAPAGFGFDPNKGSTADGLSDGMTGGLSGSMADGLFTGVPFGGVPNFTAPVVPMSKESSELWQKFLHSRAKDAQKHMNTGKK